mmetsp:Transcript_58723/g.134706  ORF Transcript_58723/g.134706 Transcript_58723/m.134706 type:complete len:232 (+) Transcript_58723:194-889(+)
MRHVPWLLAASRRRPVRCLHLAGCGLHAGGDEGHSAGHPGWQDLDTARREHSSTQADVCQAAARPRAEACPLARPNAGNRRLVRGGGARAGGGRRFRGEDHLCQCRELRRGDQSGLLRLSKGQNRDRRSGSHSERKEVSCSWAGRLWRPILRHRYVKRNPPGQLAHHTPTSLWRRRAEKAGELDRHFAGTFDPMSKPSRWPRARCKRIRTCFNTGIELNRELRPRRTRAPC